MGVREKRRGKGGIAIRLNMQTRGGYRIPGTRYKHAKGVRADKSVNRGISLVLNAHTKESFFPSERNFEKTLSAKKKKKNTRHLCSAISSDGEGGKNWREEVKWRGTLFF